MNEALSKMHLETARQLQQNLGENLSSLRAQLAQMNQNDQLAVTGIKDNVDQMAQTVEDAYELIQQNFYAFTSNHNARLEEMFSGYARQVAQRAGFHLDFATHGTPLLVPDRVVRHLYLVFREAMSNIEAHAQATQVRVSIEWDGNVLAIIIADNGCGFEPSESPERGRHGLNFMKQHSEQINSTFNLRSAPGKGTTLAIQYKVE